MKLTELISSIGDENIQFQNLDSAIINLDYTAKRGTKITFGTPTAVTPEGTERLGLVIWLDRKTVSKLMAQKEPRS